MKLISIAEQMYGWPVPPDPTRQREDEIAGEMGSAPCCTETSMTESHQSHHAHMTDDDKTKLLRRFERSLGGIVSMNPDDFEPATIYHYTGANGVVGILTEGQFRLTNYSFLNDPSEVDYGRKLILNCIKSRRETAGKKKTELLNTELLNAVETSFGEQLTSEIYVGCFSARRDDLSQWRAYGSGIGGRYCIGFDLDGLYSCCENENISLHRVTYDVIEQGTLAFKILDGLVDFIKKEELDQASALRVAHCAGQRLARLAPRLKSDAYSAEEEWRVVSFVPACSIQKVCFEATGGSVRPFIYLRLYENQQLPVSELIVLAPSRPDPTRKAANMLLRKAGVVNLQAELSAVPFVD